MTPDLPELPADFAAAWRLYAASRGLDPDGVPQLRRAFFAGGFAFYQTSVSASKVSHEGLVSHTKAFLAEIDREFR